MKTLLAKIGTMPAVKVRMKGKRIPPSAGDAIKFSDQGRPFEDAVCREVRELSGGEILYVLERM